MATIVDGDLGVERADELRTGGIVAWDTETSGLDWVHDRLGTCQVRGLSSSIDVVQVADRTPRILSALLADDSVVKVMHHAPFDLRFMRRSWGTRAANVRCTKIASKLLRPTAPSRDHSLGALTRRYLGIDLDKGSVRTSDWSSSSLTPEQVTYAAGDVENLLELYDVLVAELETMNRRELFEECCAFLPAQVEVSMLGLDDAFAY
ncbi:ribonuclease D [Cellulosimicrobium cellulans]|uniref:ribonuclease D n=1 Tax=Cellulosimicrobium cellulans TaxID=1710 RepID=UPI00365FC92C